MLGAVLVGVALLLGIGATSLAWSQARRASAAIAEDHLALTLALKRLPLAERLGELARRAEPGSWEHQLAAEALAAPDEAARVAAVNLALADVEHALTEGAAWPRAGLRIALLGTGVLASVAFIAEREQIRWWLSILAIGGVAAFACWEAGRNSQRNAARRRRAVDELVAAALGEAAHEQGARGERSRGRDIAPRRGVSHRLGRRRF